MKNRFCIILCVVTLCSCMCGGVGQRRGERSDGRDFGSGASSGLTDVQPARTGGTEISERIAKQARSESRRIRALEKAVGSRLEAPDRLSEEGCDLLDYPGFAVLYSRETKTPVWVAYELTAEETEGTCRRESGFYRDPDYAGPQAEDQDYRRSGWTRGHMAPAGDMKWSVEAMLTSCYFTNICPQSERLNSGMWKSLEERCRSWAGKYGRVYIVCGPLFSGETRTIGAGRVRVPDSFFKAVLIPVDGSYVCAGYLYTNDPPVEKNVMTVDALEEIIGMDLFHSLPGRIARQAESSLDRKLFR